MNEFINHLMLESIKKRISQPFFQSINQVVKFLQCQVNFKPFFPITKYKKTWQIRTDEAIFIT